MVHQVALEFWTLHRNEKRGTLTRSKREAVEDTPSSDKKQSGEYANRKLCLIQCALHSTPSWSECRGDKKFSGLLNSIAFTVHVHEMRLQTVNIKKNQEMSF